MYYPHENPDSTENFFKMFEGRKSLSKEEYKKRKFKIGELIKNKDFARASIQFHDLLLSFPKLDSEEAKNELFSDFLLAFSLICEASKTQNENEGSASSATVSEIFQLHAKFLCLYLYKFDLSDEKLAALLLAASAVSFSDTEMLIQISNQLCPIKKLRSLYPQLAYISPFEVVHFHIEPAGKYIELNLDFRHTIDTSIDIKKLVQVTPSAGDVKIFGNKIKIEGLKHGTSYKCTIKKDLLSSCGESLVKDYQLAVEVPDISSHVFFKHKAAVLPKIQTISKESKISVSCINTKKIKLELYQVLEPSGGLISSGYLSSNALLQKTKRVWKGSIEIPYSNNKVVNVEVPIDKMLPFVRTLPIQCSYFLRAQVGDTEYYGYNSDSAQTERLLVTDIGLSAIRTKTGDILVSARSISSTSPYHGARVSILSKNGRTLAEGYTDKYGKVLFPSKIFGDGARISYEMLGKSTELTTNTQSYPAKICASHKTGGTSTLIISDLSDKNNDSIDLSGYDIEGRDRDNPIDLFITTDRTLYRPSETVNVVGAIKCSDIASSVNKVPITVKLKNPAGDFVLVKVLRTNEAGAFSCPIELKEYFLHGQWKIEAYSDPSARPLKSLDIVIASFNSPSIELDASASDIDLSGNITLNVECRHSFGIPAEGLDSECSVSVVSGLSPKDLNGYSFECDAFEEEMGAHSKTINLGRFGKDGKIKIALPLRQIMSKPVIGKVKISVKVADQGGFTVKKDIFVSIHDSAESFVAIKPLFDPKKCIVNDSSNDNTSRTSIGFLAKIIDNKAKARIKNNKPDTKERFVYFALYKKSDWHSYRINKKLDEGSLENSSRSISYVSHPKIFLVKEGRVHIPTGKNSAKIVLRDIEAPSDYVIKVFEDTGKIINKYNFSLGSVNASNAPQIPTAISLVTDKKSYKIGDKLSVRFAAPFENGVANVSVMSDEILDTKDIRINKKSAQASFSVTKKWANGVYIIVNAYRPLETKRTLYSGPAASLIKKFCHCAENSSTETEKIAFPLRSVGITWVDVEKSENIEIKTDSPNTVRPLDSLKINIDTRSARIPADESSPVYVCAFLTDDALLSISEFKPISPAGYFSSKYKYSGNLYDLYDYINLGIKTISGELKTGGGGVGSINSYAYRLPFLPKQSIHNLLALSSCMTKVGKNGTATIKFKLPEFTGTARLTVMAFSANASGLSEKLITIKDPVIFETYGPKFLTKGDKAVIPYSIYRTDGKSGTVNISISNCSRISQENFVASDLPFSKNDKKKYEGKFFISAIDSTNANNEDPSYFHTQKFARLDANISVPGYAPYTRTVFLPVYDQKFDALRYNVAEIAPGKTEKISIPSEFAGNVLIKIQANENFPVPLRDLLLSIGNSAHDLYGDTLVNLAIPLLYTDSAVAISGGKISVGFAKSTIRKAIMRLLCGERGRGCCNSNRQIIRMDYHYTSSKIKEAEFAINASEAGYSVDKRIFENFEQFFFRLVNSYRLFRHDMRVSNPDRDEYINNIAHGFFVISKTGNLSLSDFKHFVKDIESCSTPLAKIYIAGAFALNGNSDLAVPFLKNGMDEILGLKKNSKVDDISSEAMGISRICSAIIVLSEIFDSLPDLKDEELMRALVTKLTELFSKRTVELNGEEKSLLLRAAFLSKSYLRSSYSCSANSEIHIQAAVDGGQTAKISETSSATEFTCGENQRKVSIRNHGKNKIWVSVTMSGQVNSIEPRGILIKKEFFSQDGKLISIKELRQNDLVCVVISGKREVAGRPASILLTDKLAAAFAVEKVKDLSPHLEKIIHSESSVLSQENRGNTQYAVLQLGSSQKEFKFYYMVRVTTAGLFSIPGAVAEDLATSSIKANTDEKKARVYQNSEKTIQ
ncbi:alpha-2-macroglobulin [Candidatus Hydrogenosomobacter endosymbioticus]|uniref:Alpha-2-macroglobulin n=2 Tax=Candidatus Hydrogenosomobacter endosymbioticus TaxID=2558174 RepID=A0ABM7V8C8_9PROT|nr:alpha-2-macroglobulin [Candidatus Hydrogenosomobacter endosymbioticus]